MHAATLLLSVFSAEQWTEAEVTDEENATRVVESAPVNTTPLEPEEFKREQRKEEDINAQLRHYLPCQTLRHDGDIEYKRLKLTSCKFFNDKLIPKM